MSIAPNRECECLGPASQHDGNACTRRRALAGALAGAALGLAWTGAACAQPAQRRRVGVLVPFTLDSVAELLQALREGFAAQGLEVGRDLTVELRHADNQPALLAPLAAEIAALGPEVVIALGPGATEAALAATAGSATPIVSIGDVVAAGHASQLGRPGGRVTGLSFLPLALNTKRLELLAELLPKGSAVLNLIDLTPFPAATQAVQDAGRQLGLVPHAAYASTPAEVETAFARAQALRVAGVNVLASPFLHGVRAMIMQLALRARLPAIYQWPETAREGGLMGYGPSSVAMFRQLAGYAARILRGAKPGELPIEQPTKVEFVINLKAARAIGVEMPRALLLRADEVIG